MSLVLDGATQAAYRDAADIQSLLPFPSKVSMWVKLAALPGSGFATLLSHDRDESSAQVLTFRLKPDGTVRVQLVTASDDDSNANKDTTGTIPVDEWVQVILDLVSSNGSNNYTIGVDIDGSAEQVSPTGAGAYRTDLCTFLGFGAAITSSAVFHSFLTRRSPRSRSSTRWIPASRTGPSLTMRWTSSQEGATSRFLAPRPSTQITRARSLRPILHPTWRSS